MKNSGSVKCQASISFACSRVSCKMPHLENTENVSLKPVS